VIVSDDAGQFNVGQHGLCWVHSERLVHKLDAFTDENRAAQATARKLIWNFYRDLKAYRCDPTKQRKAALRARFDRIFKRKTGFVTLDRLLARLNANKPELLMVLDRPEIPLHTNGSENDIRCHVTRRKISAGTRSDIVIAAMPFSVSPKPAPSSKSRSGTTLATDSASRALTLSHACPKSSSPEPNRPNGPAFCPSYIKSRQVTAMPRVKPLGQAYFAWGCFKKMRAPPPGLRARYRNVDR